MASNVGISLSTVVDVEERKELGGRGGGGRRQRRRPWRGWEQTLKTRTAAAGRLNPAGPRHTSGSLSRRHRGHAQLGPTLARSAPILAVDVGRPSKSIALGVPLRPRPWQTASTPLPSRTLPTFTTLKQSHRSRTFQYTSHAVRGQCSSVQMEVRSTAIIMLPMYFSERMQQPESLPCFRSWLGKGSSLPPERAC